jgi:hypothetical protein
MTREITGKNYHLRPIKTRSNPYRILLFVVLILAGIWLLIQ